MPSYSPNGCKNNKEELDAKELQKKRMQEMEWALIRAAFLGNLECVKSLITSGVNINAVDGNLDSALNLACTSVKREVVQYLLEQGASPNEANIYGFTPLVAAVNRNDDAMVVLLLRYVDFRGCSHTIKPGPKEKDLHRRCVTDYGYPDEEDKWVPALIYAVRNESDTIVKMLLDANVPVNELDPNHSTALHHAVLRNDRPQILKLLLSAKPDIDARDGNSKTPLIIACEQRKEDFILLLLQHGANADCIPRRGRGRSALNTAVEYASKEVVQALCEASSDISSVERPIVNKFSSLRLAIQFKNMEAVRTLIYYGCLLDTPERVQHFGTRVPFPCTLLDYTLPGMNIEMFQILNAARAFTNKQLYNCYNNENFRGHCANEVFHALGQNASNPANLMYLCRKAVRDVLQTPFPMAVPKLGLPPVVREFLLYCDI